MANSSYHHLAQVYDHIFPLDSDALAFVLGTDPKIMVDAGCGTGLLVRALADHGVRAHGFDLDPDLLAVADQRAGKGASYGPGDLRQFEVPEGLSPIDLITCFGNTLAHLADEEEIQKFLARAASLLRPRGTLMIQILDYEFLEKSGTLVLPERTIGLVTFHRHYVIQSPVCWTFHTSLSGPLGTDSGAFDLRPWRRAELVQILGRSGFRVEGVWGGFDLRLPGSSLPLVLRATLL